MVLSTVEEGGLDSAPFRLHASLHNTTRVIVNCLLWPLIRDSLELGWAVFPGEDLTKPGEFSARPGLFFLPT